MNVNQVLVERLATELLEQGATVATAESCTGGWIAKTLTDRPGSSDWFGTGIVSYSNAAKTALLGVAPVTLEQHGAVSEATALAMARGAQQQAAADYSVAVTGVAGPDGGTPDKPVGTVWIAWAGPQDAAQAALHHFDGDRDTVRRQTVTTALHGLVERVANRR